jgi:hypothetical protein
VKGQCTTLAESWMILKLDTPLLKNYVYLYFIFVPNLNINY